MDIETQTELKPRYAYVRCHGGQRVSELQRGPAMGVALVVVGNEPMIDPRRLAETVAQNRGGIGRTLTIRWAESSAAWESATVMQIKRDEPKGICIRNGDGIPKRGRSRDIV